MKIRTLVLAAALLLSIPGIGGRATAAVPPSWLQMTMPSVTFNTTTKKLAVEDAGINAPLAANTLPNGNLTAGVGTFDPLQPYTVLNGTVFSRRLGWNDPAATSLIQDDINSVYGFQADGFTPRGYVWIQSMSQSPGLNTYLAVGNWGVNADGSMTVDTMNPTGPIYSGIFGTAGSSTKWKWDAQMDHNAYAVPFSFLTKPNQIFSAYYKLFVGDAAGNELLTDKNGTAVASAATTTVWTWQGPPFVFTSQTGVAVSTLVESDVFTHTGAGASISATGGEYAISTDGGLTWGAWSTSGTISTNDTVKVRQTSSATPGTATTAVLAIPTAIGSGTFRVTTAGTNPVDTIPNAFTFTSLTIAPASTLTESSVVTVSGINAPAAISVSAGGQYAVSTDNGLSWGAWTSLAGTVADTNQLKVRLTSSATPGTSVSTTLTIGGVAALFSVTTGSPVTPSASFNSVTNAPANTSVSGMPFYVMSNPIATTADSAISVAGGITPQYSVSTDGGYNWSAWSSTTPATVTAGSHVKVRVVPATTAFTTSVTNLTLGGTVTSFSVTTSHANPASWMPMAMLNVAYDTVTKKLTVQDLHTHASFPGTTLPALTSIPAGAYDPTKPWGILNNGMYLSRQLGWDDATALHGSGITVTGGLVNQILTAYGAGASIWIERIDQSPGLETYFADGMFGVGGTGSGTSGTPQVYSSPVTGRPIIYANNYYGIFGTAGSSTRWKWDGTMIHNVYAIPAAYITQPDQVFSATYRVYVGDAAGNEILNTDGSSTSTTEVWSWKGPATVQPSVARLEWIGAQVNNGNGTLKAWWPTCATPGATFTVTATPASGIPVSVSGITAQYHIFNGLSNGVYTVSVKADKAGMLSSIKAAAGTVTVTRVVAAPEWVGAQRAGFSDIKIWWPVSTAAGATYTVFVNGNQAATGLTTTTHTYAAPANGTYNVTVRADLAGAASSTPKAAAAVVLNQTNPAYAWLGVQKHGVDGVKLWWPTIAGATFTIRENGTIINPTILTSGGLSYVLLTGLTTPGSYGYTIQNTSAGFNPSMEVAGSAAVTF